MHRSRELQTECRSLARLAAEPFTNAFELILVDSEQIVDVGHFARQLIGIIFG